jgi:hypothetical protein
MPGDCAAMNCRRLGSRPSSGGRGGRGLGFKPAGALRLSRRLGPGWAAGGDARDACGGGAGPAKQPTRKMLGAGAEAGRAGVGVGGLGPEEKRGGLTDGWIQRICTCARARAVRGVAAEARGQSPSLPRQGLRARGPRGKEPDAAGGGELGRWAGAQGGPLVLPRQGLTGDGEG